MKDASDRKYLRSGEDRSRAPAPGGGSAKKREKYKWADLDAAGEFLWVPKDELYVDVRYQREVKSSTKVLEIAKAWSWARCGVLLVAIRPDATWVVFDGQHRWVASMLRDDIQDLPCMVFELGGLSAEALAFYHANTSKSAVSPFDRHKALLTAGEEPAVTAERIVRSHGYRVSKSTGTPWTTRAILSVHEMVNRDPDTADKVFELAAHTAGGGHITSIVLKALEWVASKDEAVFDPLHRERLAKLGTEVLDAEINRYRAMVGKGGARVYGEAVLALLNKGRRTNHLGQSG